MIRMFEVLTVVALLASALIVAGYFGWKKFKTRTPNGEWEVYKWSRKDYR